MTHPRIEHARWGFATTHEQPIQESWTALPRLKNHC